MKRFFSMVMAVMLCISILAIPANAAGGQLSVSNETVKRGDTVTVNISSSSAEFAFLKLIVGFDTDVLSVVECKSYISGIAFVSEGGTLVWSNADNVAVNGTIASVTFKVADNASRGAQSISVNVFECYDEDLNDVSIGNASGTITVTIPPCANHTWGTGTVIQHVGCETDELTQYTCTVCGETKTETTQKATGHVWDDGKVTTDPGCETEGVKTFTCKNDPSHTKTEPVAATGHIWDDGKVTTEPSCKTAGVKTFTCQNDPSHTRTEAIPAAGHKWDEGKVTTPPTCEKDGVKTYTCTACSETKTEKIPALGHAWGEWTQTKAPACTEKGIETRTCKHDASHTETRDIPATGHAWDTGTVTTKPTCTEKGVMTYTCTHAGCTETKTEEIPATGHHFSDPVVTKQPTCTKPGEETGTCESCGKTTSQAIPALGHDWGEWKVTKAPTCTEKGVETRVCKHDETHTETRDIPATGHTYTLDHDDTNHWQVCKDCGDIIDKEPHGPWKVVELEPSTTTKHGKGQEICEDCGYEGKIVELPLKTADYDKSPKTGDITGQLVLGGVSILALAAAALYLLKRKLAK